MVDIMYKIPGKNHGPKGLTYDWVKVGSLEEKGMRLKTGWFTLLTEAISDSKGEAKPVKEPTDAPTREELKVQAVFLGLKFQNNIPNDKLLILINKKLEAGV